MCFKRLVGCLLALEETSHVQVTVLLVYLYLLNVLLLDRVVQVGNLVPETCALALILDAETVDMQIQRVCLGAGILLIWKSLRV